MAGSLWRSRFPTSCAWLVHLVIGVANPLQVAVARHLGLVGLRLIDSIILPLNTTQYALELDDYLDQSVYVSRFLSRSNLYI